MSELDKQIDADERLIKSQVDMVDKLEDIASYLNESGPFPEIISALNDIATTLAKIEQRMK